MKVSGNKLYTEPIASEVRDIKMHRRYPRRGRWGRWGRFDLCISDPNLLRREYQVNQMIHT